MGRGSGRPGGNPEFGTKYRAEKKAVEALSEQVGTRVSLKTKTQLKQLAEKNNCSIPDLIREALEMYLAGAEEQKAA